MKAMIWKRSLRILQCYRCLILAIFAIKLLPSSGASTSSSYTPATSCDFESMSICGFTQDHSGHDSFEWTRRSLRTPTMGTGPSVDNTLGTSAGHFMYIETSYPRRPGDKARLNSPIYPKSTSSSCLKFWYHMYGNLMGTLNVYAVLAGTYHNIWSKSGNQSNAWRLASATVPPSPSGTYQIVFEGIVGSGYRSDAAIDDYSITPGGCSVPGLSPDVNISVLPSPPTVGKPFTLQYTISTPLKDRYFRIAYVTIERDHKFDNNFVGLVQFDGNSRNITYLDTNLIVRTSVATNITNTSNALGYEHKMTFSLTFNNALCNDSGRYRWTMSYDTDFALGQTLSSTSNVTVGVQETAPGKSDDGLIILPGHGLNITEGSKLQVKCQADVGRHPQGDLKIYLHFPNGTLDLYPVNVSDKVNEHNCTFVREAELSMVVSRKYKGASFQCMLHQGSYTNSRETDPINVLYSPSGVSITRYPDHQVYSEGDNVLLNCTADGNPPPSITWRKVNDYLSVTNSVLVLNNIQLTDAGEYICTASYDYINMAYTKSIRISVAGHLTRPSTSPLGTSSASSSPYAQITSSSTGTTLSPTSAAYMTTRSACHDYPGYPCSNIVNLKLCSDNYIASVYCEKTCQRCDPPAIIGR